MDQTFSEAEKSPGIVEPGVSTSSQAHRIEQRNCPFYGLSGTPSQIIEVAGVAGALLGLVLFVRLGLRQGRFQIFADLPEPRQALVEGGAAVAVRVFFLLAVGLVGGLGFPDDFP